MTTSEPEYYLHGQVTTALATDGFSPHVRLMRGWLFSRSDGVKLMVDYDIRDRSKPFTYTEYIEEQNRLMRNSKSLYRWLVESPADVEPLLHQLRFCLHHGYDEDDNKVRAAGVNRAKQAIDPTAPEAFFEQAFIDVYGRKSFNSVLREYPVIDINGSTRYVDYYIQRKDYNIAIEKNGETYHHPLIVDRKRYLSQLVKQNSLVAYGDKVYRWSLESMRFAGKFHDELKQCLGASVDFIHSQHVSISRDFKLYSHQKNTLAQLNKGRTNGLNAALVVHPTGTGKTQILLSELENVFNSNHKAKILILAPSRVLCQQLTDILQNSILTDSDITIGAAVENSIIVRTYAWISRHYREFDKNYFAYITIDEAHHAVAPTVCMAIKYFTPEYLLGLTATDQRLDKQKLSSVFGEYETSFTLKEAITQGLLVPIKAFRVHSNIDLSKIRFNGKDFVNSDLQRTVVVPSRDQLIVDVLLKYFSSSGVAGKSGLVFCVTVAHAKAMARCLRNSGFSAQAVSGQDNQSEKNIAAYQKGEIQFLTTCSLLTEGWDSPRTSIIVMARPTMSKVLYTQQIGRGTRRFEGKEALYVIDVVDNYGYLGGILNQPWSIHSLLGISQYKDFADILNPQTSRGDEEQLLALLHEQERSIQEINIFTFEEKYPDHLSDEQLARELFVSTGTVKAWVKKGKITPEVAIPFGRGMLHYFSPGRLDEIRNRLGLARHDDTTILNDLNTFLEKGDYAFSYKMIMLLNMLNLVDNSGECDLDRLVVEYIAWYRSRIAQKLPVDRERCPYDDNHLKDTNYMRLSLLSNPFEKFERKRFMHYCNDLNRISFSNVLWEHINSSAEKQRIKKLMFNDLQKHFETLGGLGDVEHWQNVWKIEET
ncbi:MAG: DEAD/DEAH box helicase [Deltaproteobacteria bacterium]|nr:DEAD/DEAH box helicase [Deltaproteobacteria bacterium]